MKPFITALFVAFLLVPAAQSQAKSEEPQVYVIQQGDTLWGLSEKFLRDPKYWPDLWARNPALTNPHVIFPGQKLKFYPDRVEIVTDEPPPLQPVVAAPEAAPAVPPAKQEVVKEVTFPTSGGEGFLVEENQKLLGRIISTNQNRQIVGEDDIVYIDIGRNSGARVGDRFSIFRRAETISHPVTNQIMGFKAVPLGTLQISELEDKVSKALITKSFQEIDPGSYLLPYSEKKRSVPLQAADRDLTGFIVETKTGNKAIATGDIAYIDLGKFHGIKPGNLVYIVRDVPIDSKYIDAPVGKLPPEVIGALVVLETAQTTSTALVVKSIDTIYRGDRVEVIKSR